MLFQEPFDPGQKLFSFVYGALRSFPFYVQDKVVIAAMPGVHNIAVESTVLWLDKPCFDKLQAELVDDTAVLVSLSCASGGQRWPHKRGHNMLD